MSVYEKAFLTLLLHWALASISTNWLFSSTLYRQRRLQVVWISCLLRSTITSISASCRNSHWLLWFVYTMMPVYASVRSQTASFHRSMKKGEKNQLKNEWKWKNDFGCWGSVGLSGILFLSLSFLSPPSPSFPVYFTPTLSHFSLYVIISQWLACF